MPLKLNQDELPTMNLTSMIDVLFLLIIFFMVGSTLVDAEKSVAVKIPEVKHSQNLSAVPDKRIVNVYKSGQIALDSRDVSLDQLADRILCL